MLLSRSAFRGKCLGRRARPRLAVEALEARRLMTLIGSPFQVNTTPTNQQPYSAHASAPGLSSVVVWEHEYSPSDRDIRGQRLDGNGNKLGGEFVVVQTGKPEYHPAVAMDHAGNFVVVYTLDYNSTDKDVRAIRFSANGTPLGGSFPVAQSVATDEYDPSVAMDADGNFVVSYTVETGDGSRAVWARVFSANGVGASPFEVYGSPAANAYSSSVARAADGRFAVAFELLWTASGNKDVEVRRYNAAGTFLSWHGLYTSRSDAQPDVAMDNTGRIVLVFMSSTSNFASIRYVRVSAGGVMSPEEVIAAPALQVVHSPAVALDAGGSGGVRGGVPPRLVVRAGRRV